MSVFGLIASSNFVIVNRDIVRAVGLEAAFMLSELASEEKYYEDNDIIDDGFFYSTIQNIESQTGLSQYKQTAALKVLEARGLLKCEVRGMPAKRYFKLLPDGLQKIICSKPVTKKLDNKKPKDLITRNQNSRQLVSEKFDNKISKNSTQIISNPTISKKPDQKKDIYTSADAEEVISYLNEKTGKHFKPEGNNAKLIHAREKEGYTLNDFKKVIDIKVNEWGNDARMCRYLKPSTLFAPSHFDDYLNQPEPKSTTESADSLLEAIMERRKNRENRNNSENVINAQYSVHEEMEPDRDAESCGHMGDAVSGGSGRDRDSGLFAVSEDVPY